MPTGTLVLPAESDVRNGVEYGAAGTEFTGTLAVPVSGNVSVFISRLEYAVAVLRSNGLIENVTVEQRLSGDTYATAEGWEAHRMPGTSTDTGGLAENTVTWGLYKIAGQARDPIRLSRITVVATGEIWHVWSVEKGYAGYHFRASCVRQVA